MSTYEISKSSLLSLKAEILRKQEELQKTKLQNNIKRITTLKKPLEIKNKGVEQRNVEDSKYNEEEENLLKKSRAALESKARLYEKLTKRRNFTDQEIEENRRFLVRFDKKKKPIGDLPPEGSDEEADLAEQNDSEDEHFSDDYEPAKNPEEEWVEYTDCLGRTRKCMRKDLAFLKSKDEELRGVIDKPQVTEKCSSTSADCGKSPESPNERTPEEFNEESELLSSDMRRDLLRQQWEDEERELLKKDDVHYQDVLFNEARTHGVGYYGFSKDEEERAKQQEALKNLRLETEQQQRKAQELKRLREKQLAARTKAARNRKRARMGLPPEENEPEVLPDPDTTIQSIPTEEKEKSPPAKDEEEKILARKKHVRPWDVGKQGVKEHYEYTQDEWVDKQRKERKKEFAPPTAYQRDFRGSTKDVDLHKTSCFSTRQTSRNKNKTNEPKVSQNPYKTKESFDFTQTCSSSNHERIVNECEDFDDVQDSLLNDYRVMEHDRKSTNSSESDLEEDHGRGKGVEVAPPPTMEYYGAGQAKKMRSDASKGNLEDSIRAGLRFLRTQAEKKDTSTKHPSEVFLM